MSHVRRVQDLRRSNAAQPIPGRAEVCKRLLDSLGGVGDRAVSRAVRGGGVGAAEVLDAADVDVDGLALLAVGVESGACGFPHLEVQMEPVPGRFTVVFFVLRL